MSTTVRHTRVHAGLSAITAAAVLWGTAGLAGRQVGEATGIAPVAVGWYRLVIAAVVLLAWRALRGGGRLRVPRRELPRVALVGTGLAGYQVCYFTAVDRVGVSVATLVTLGLAPVLVAAATAARARMRPSAAALTALGLALAGLGLLVGVPNPVAGVDLAAGVAFSTASAAGYAAVTLLSRALADRIPPLDLTAVGFAVGAAMVVPVAVSSGLDVGTAPSTLGLLLYLGVLPTAVAYGLFFTGLRTVSATTAAVVTLLEPLTAAVLAALLLGERLGVVGVVGGLLLCAAVAASARDPAADG